MHEQADTQTDYLTLTQVAKLAPGRPSSNCIWRWCRRGVKARTGERVRLQHIRMGGMIYTTTEWLNEFGSKLAEADIRYFKLCDAAKKTERSQGRRHTRSPAQAEEDRLKQIEAADRELDRAGI